MENPRLQIPRVSLHELSEEDFVNRFLLPNQPCLLTDVDACFQGLMEDWPTFSAFLESMGEYNLSPSFIKQCRPPGTSEPFTVRDYLDADPQAYLKDWHLQAELEAGNQRSIGYNIPNYLGGDCLYDWLNFKEVPRDYQTEERPEYRFVYAGKRGSSTPLHFDVLASYSWSCNIVGRKRWVFFHESSLPSLMRDNTVIDMSEVDAALPRVELLQERGEIVFVPSRWAHCVENLEDCISVNHNWLNAASLERLWGFLLTEWKAVSEEMVAWGIRNEDGAGAQLLRANSKIDFQGYGELLALGRKLSEESLERGSSTFASWSVDMISQREEELSAWLAETSFKPA